MSQHGSLIYTPCDAHGTAVQDRREEDAERRVVGHVREAPLAEPLDDLGHVLALFRACVRIEQRRRRPRHLIAAPRGTPRADALAVVRPRAPRPRLRFLLGRRGGRNLWSCQQGRGCRWRFRRRYTRGLGGRRCAGRIIRCPSFVRRRSPIVPSPSFVGRVWRQRWPRRARVPVGTLIGEAFHGRSQVPVARCRASQGRGGLLGPHRAVYIC